MKGVTSDPWMPLDRSRKGLFLKEKILKIVLADDFFTWTGFQSCVLQLKDLMMEQVLYIFSFCIMDSLLIYSFLIDLENISE